MELKLVLRSSSLDDASLVLIAFLHGMREESLDLDYLIFKMSLILWVGFHLGNQEP